MDFIFNIDCVYLIVCALLICLALYGIRKRKLRIMKRKRESAKTTVSDIVDDDFYCLHTQSGHSISGYIARK